MISFRAAEDRKEWDNFVDSCDGHALQTWGWGEVKGKHGWKAERIFFEKGGEVIGGAQILRRRLPIFKGMFYVPRGPVARSEKDKKNVLIGLTNWAERARGKAVCLMVEPDWVEFPKSLKKWRKTKNRILLADTTVVDLSGGLDTILEKMPKNRRRDVKKYLESGLKLEKVENEKDFKGALKIYKEISARAGFNLHEDEYYLDIWREMGEHQWLGVVKNEEGKAIAFQWALLSGEKGFALFAGVGDEGRRRRINVGVKFECMQILKDLGVEKYDFNGLLNEGVSDYKMAFGGEEVRLCGAWELPLSGMYGVYAKSLPMGKKLVQFFEKLR